MTFRTITSSSTKSKSIFAISNNSVFASSETFFPTTKSCESSGERVPGTKIITLSTSYLFKQKGRRSRIRQTFILKNYGSRRIVSQKLYSISHLSGHQKNKCKNTACKGFSFVTIETSIQDSVQKSKTF